MSKQSKASYGFGSFRLDAGERQLLRDGKPMQLAPKVFDTLLALVENSGRLMDKDELKTKLWPDTFVEEATLARNISDLRKALGESSGKDKYIDTVPKSGYRFVAKVAVLEDDAPELIIQRHVRSRVVIEEETESGPRAGSIAVLPFKTLGGADDDYLGLGMADALITRLSNIRRISVRPTSAVSKYVDERQDPFVAGRELNVESVVGGGIQRSGGHIRVTVQLVSVRNEATLWAGKFDEKFTGIFAIEDSISEQIVRALTLRLNGDERRLLARRYTEDAGAYQEYLKARYYLNKRTTSWLRKGVEHFQRAIEIDPDYATAYAGLADSYTLLVTWEAMAPLDGFPKATAAAKRALQIEPSLAEAHASLGHALLHSWQWDGSEKAFRTAVDCNPGYAPAHQWYAEYLAAMGRFDEAVAEARRAQELDPLSVVHSADVGFMLYYARRYDEAVEQLQHAIDMEPDFWIPHHLLGLTYTQKGMHEEALSECHNAMGLSGKGALSVVLIGHAYAAAGQRSEALAVIEQLNELSKRRYFSPYGIALIHAGLNNDEEAFDCLEEAYTRCDARLIWLKVDPALDSLRSDLRFGGLLRRLGFNEE
jgi:DNA-binding winged helix-turn-helix (wHTH) protein/tetratricopeptide (TPR) repeat protein